MWDERSGEQSALRGSSNQGPSRATTCEQAAAAGNISGGGGGAAFEKNRHLGARGGDGSL